MSIDLTVYVSLSKEESNKILKVLTSENPEIFKAKFLLYDAGEANEIDKEIALEYGLRAQSEFFVGLNDKSAANQMQKVADLLKDALGRDNVVILLLNETQI
jgi:hypothetical protein